MAYRKTADIIENQEIENAEAVETRRPANKRIPIMIPSDDSDMGKGDVVVGCNGEIITIQRDVVVEIKEGHYNALMDAVKTELILDGNGKVIGSRRVPRYNVQRMG